MNVIKKYPIVTFFALTLLWSDGIWVLLVPDIQRLLNLQLDNRLAWIGLMGPGLFAIGISAVLNGKEGVSQLFKPLLKWKVPYFYYIFVSLGVFLFYYAASWLTFFLSHTKPMHSISWLLKNVEAPFFGLHGLWVIVEITIIYTFCEELGWRGFALPRMAESLNALYSAAVLGVFWAIWHIPLIYVYGSSLTVNSGIIYFLHIECLSIIYAWLYFRTDKSLLLCGLFHGATDGVGSFFPLTASTIGQGPNLTTLSLEIMVALLMIPYLLKLRTTHVGMTKR